MKNFHALLAALFAAASPAAAGKAPQSEYSAELLDVKTLFAGNELEALAQPFVGVATSDGVVGGLYPIRVTGVSTEPMRTAAQEFLAALSPEQKIRAQYAIDDPRRRQWSNVGNSIYVRSGVSLKEMSKRQRGAAEKLMKASLSARGLALTESIRKTDQTLREINDGVGWFDEDLYYFKIFGIPTEESPWGWQVQGHHLVINYFVLSDQIVMTPTFLGGEPAVARIGKYKGNSVLQDEQALGLAFVRALDDHQRAAAILDSEKTGRSIRGEANSDNLVLDYEGVRAASFTPAQRDLFLDLIERFIGVMDEGHAAVKLEDIARNLDDTWFAWVGSTEDDAVFYYRIHSPVVLIEFDHQSPAGTRSINPPDVPTRDHVHVVIRTPNGNDYGKDLLAQHLAAVPH